jgi:hypothetical protein
MAAEEERADPVPAARADAVARADAAAVGAARLDDAEIVNQVVMGMDLKGMDAQGSGLWSRKRA